MTPTIITLTPPPGFRFMLAHEAERLSSGDPIQLITAGGMEHGLVRSHTDEAMSVTLRSGAIITLDLDDPEYWGSDEHRDRRPPMSVDGECVAIKRTEADEDAEIEPLMRTSVALATLMKDDEELRKAVAEVRRIVSARLRGIAA